MTDIAINPVTRRVQFVGTTGTGPYAFSFNILQASDIAVYKNNTLLSIGTGSANYSVSIAANGTGSVSLVTALISSDVLVLIGGRELSRTTDFVTAGDLLASSLNEQLDSNVVMSQQLDERITRSIITQPGDSLKNLYLPLVADRASEILTFDASGNVTTTPVSEIVGANIDTQKVTVKTSGGVVKAVIDGNTTNIMTITGPVILKEGSNTRISINPGGAGNNIVSDGNILFTTASGDIDLKPLGGSINILGVSGQQRLALTNSGQAKLMYFQNSNTTSLGVVDPTGTRTLLLPNATDTLVGKATTDTLTNKTLASPVITGSLGVGTLTGSGDILLDAVGDIVLDAAGDQIFFKDGGTLRITFNLGAAGTSIVSASDLMTAVTSGSMNFKTSTGFVDFLQPSGAQAIQINSTSTSTICYFQNSNQTKLGAVNPTATRVLLLPNASDTLVGKATTDTLTNKTLASPVITGNLAVGTLTNSGSDIILDSSGDIILDAAGDQVIFKDGGTLRLTFNLGAAGTSIVSASDLVTTVTNGSLSFKPSTGFTDFLQPSGAQGFQINSSSSPAITLYQNSNTVKLGAVNPTATRVLLLPNANDTLVGKATTDTLTNKTLTNPTITGGLNMSDASITNVGAIALDRITNDSAAGITVDSSSGIILDSSQGQFLFKDDNSTRLTISISNSANQTLTSLAALSLTSGADINLRPNGGQLYVLSNSGGDNFQFNTSSTPTLGIHQNSNVTNIGLVNPTATRTILFPNASDTLVGKATTDTLTNKTLTSPVINTGVSGSAFLDEDNFASNSATKIASQQSIKAYVDAATAGGGAGSLSTVLGIGNTTGSNNVLFGDNNKAIFGAGSDLQIYHDGSNSYINDQGTGRLYIRASDQLRLQASDSENYALFAAGGAVKLYYDNVEKFDTTNTGVNITGTLTADGLTSSGTIKIDSATPALWLYENDATNLNGFIRNVAGDLLIQTINDAGSAVNTRVSVDHSTGDISFYEDTGSTAKFFWDASAESLGIGTSSPVAPIEISKSGTGEYSTLALTNSGASGKRFVIGLGGNTADAAYANKLYFYDSTASATRMVIDSLGSVGIGVVPEAWGSNADAMQIGNSGMLFGQNNANVFTTGSNFYWDNTNYKRINADLPSRHVQFQGEHIFGHAVSGSADTNISWLESMRIDSSGRVGIGAAPVANSGVLQIFGGNATSSSLGFNHGDNATISAKYSMIFQVNNTGAISGRTFNFATGGKGYSEGTSFLTLGGSGAIFNETGSAAQDFRVESDNSPHAIFVDSSADQVLFAKAVAGLTTNGAYMAGVNATAGTHFHLALSHTSSSDGAAIIYMNRQSSSGELIQFRQANGQKGNIGTEDGRLYIESSGAANLTGIGFSRTAAALEPRKNGTWTDNAVDVGSSTYRFDDVFATNGTIQTSDQNEKQDIAALTSAEMLVAKRISVLFKTFRWKDKVAAKGDDARTHSGIVAQDVQAAFEAESLDAGDYSMFISNIWWEHDVDVAAVEADDTVEPAIEAKDAYTRTDPYMLESEAPEGSTSRTRLGIRYPELLSFLAAYNEQRFAAIETRLTALEA